MDTGKTMLIVDDARLTRMMVRTIVHTAHPDWTILEAQNGAEALEKTMGTAIDMMTIDLNMPGIDGLTLATQLQSQHPQARIALLTANIQENVRRRAEASGVGFIAKPVTEEKILAFIA